MSLRIAGCQFTQSKATGGFATFYMLVIGAFLCLSATAEAQRVLLNETFENDSADMFPGSADFFARSSIAPDPDLDPSTAVVTGGMFADPFDPGNNQSLLLHNPDGTTQMAVTWTRVFDDDPATFRNGSIDFDLWMDSPDPDAFWTFFSTRIGHGDSERSGLGGAPSEMTTWNTFRMQNQEGNPDPIEQITDPGFGITAGLETTFTDNGDDVMGPDRSFHVRYEFEESSTSGGTFNGFPVYRLILSDTTIEWLQDSEMEHSWVFDGGAGAFAPGVNILSFLTDASAHSQDPDPGTGNVFIDNLVIINDDLSPLDTDFDADSDTDGADFLRWQRGFQLTGQTDNSNGDADGNGIVDGLDLNAWKSRFGTIISPAITTAAVPEPATWWLVWISLATGITWRPRRPGCLLAVRRI